MIKRKVVIKSKDNQGSSPEIAEPNIDTPVKADKLVKLDKLDKIEGSPTITKSKATKPIRGRPKTKPANILTSQITVEMHKIPSSRVFSVNIDNKIHQTMGKTLNNIVKLKLNWGDIVKMEKFIADKKSGILTDYLDLEETIASSDIVATASFPLDLALDLALDPQDPQDPQDPPLDSSAKVTLPIAPPIPTSGLGMGTGLGLEHFAKRRNVQLAVAKPEAVVANRKDLIINSGVKRTSCEPLQVFSDSWPMTSPYACWYCCHTFTETPVGIPSFLTNYTFKCYGNFCSYNCAKRYLCPSKDDEDDMVCLQSSNEIFKCDDHGDKLQLLELLYHLETNAPLDEPIKIAPRRLILKMFGGNKTIEEFRKSFKTNTTYHTFKMPLVSMAYHMEECIDTKSDTRRKLKNMSLDVAKLEKAYDEIMREKSRNSKLSLSKSMG